MGNLLLSLLIFVVSVVSGMDWMMMKIAPATSKRKTKRRQRGTGAIAAARQAKMLEVLQQFRVLVKSVRSHYKQVENKSGVSGAQLWALTHIAGRPGSKVGELARALAIHQSTASNLVGRLEALGLVSRARVQQDQRSVELALTAKGARAMQRAPRPLIGVLQQALSDIPVASLDALHRHLGRLIRAMKIRDTRGRSIPLSEM